MSDDTRAFIALIPMACIAIMLMWNSVILWRIEDAKEQNKPKGDNMTNTTAGNTSEPIPTQDGATVFAHSPPTMTELTNALIALQNTLDSLGGSDGSDYNRKGAENATLEAIRSVAGRIGRMAAERSGV